MWLDFIHTWNVLGWHPVWTALHFFVLFWDEQSQIPRMHSELGSANWHWRLAWQGYPNVVGESIPRYVCRHRVPSEEGENDTSHAHTALPSNFRWQYAFSNVQSESTLQWCPTSENNGENSLQVYSAVIAKFSQPIQFLTTSILPLFLLILISRTKIIQAYSCQALLVIRCPGLFYIQEEKLRAFLFSPWEILVCHKQGLCSICHIICACFLLVSWNS